MRNSSNAQFEHGFSLLEGLTILLIISILISIGTPSFTATIERSRSASHLHGLVATLNLARIHAITHNGPTVLCASQSGQRCDGDWKHGTLLFSDANNNRRLDNNEQLIERGSALGDDVSLRWQASGGRNKYIRFSRHGTAMEFGRFTYCPKTSSMVPASMLVLNRMGRVRIAKDSDGDGVVEDRNGRRANC
ncbi:MAG: GspH/FimT family pseudopilin [Pseudomonadales bacterium]